MESIDTTYVSGIKDFLQKYIDQKILDSVFIRGSLANNKIDNKISDIDLIIFYKDKRSMHGFSSRFKRFLDEMFLIKLPLDILYFHINEPLTYNIIYVLKFKSKFWIGNESTSNYIQSLNNILIENIPYSNIHRITGMLDPVIDSEILKATCNIDLTHIKLSTRHTVGLLKKIIRSTYEYLYLTNQINFIAIPCKEICERIILEPSVDNKWKDLLQNCSNTIELCKHDYYYTENNLDKVMNLYKSASSLFKDSIVSQNVKQLFTNNKYNYLKQSFSISN